MVTVYDFSPCAGIISMIGWQRRGLDRIFSIRPSGKWVGRYIELSSMDLKERNQKSREVVVSCCLGHLQSDGYGALSFMGLVAYGPNSYQERPGI